MNPPLDSRRPLKSRDTGWARRGAAVLARRGVKPDAVSAGAVVFAVIGAGAFVASGVSPPLARALALVLAALAIQARLICNLMDGMVAVEHGQGGPDGPIWNELPDRVADALFLVAAGYGAALAGARWGEPLGWLCAVLAVLTAYIRELGRALGHPADFSGPGAKPQRMAILTVAALLSAVEPLWGWHGGCLAAALALIVVLAAATAVRRTTALAGRLRAAAEA